MNLLQIGLTAKHLSYPSGSLVISDEPISAEAAKHFDVAQHGLNTLRMEYREAREFAAALFPNDPLLLDSLSALKTARRF